jgi:hypothetical protein
MGRASSLPPFDASPSRPESKPRHLAVGEGGRALPRIASSSPSSHGTRTDEKTIPQQTHQDSIEHRHRKYSCRGKTENTVIWMGHNYHVHHGRYPGHHPSPLRRLVLPDWPERCSTSFPGGDEDPSPRWVTHLFCITQSTTTVFP